MRCTLRPWSLDDVSQLARMLGNTGIQDNLRDLPYPYTEQDARDYIQSALAAERDTTYAFAIAVDGALVGSIAASRGANVHRRTAELGYFVAQECWGRGIATEAVRQICEYIFENTDILRICAEPYAHNAASCRVLEKAGFEFEGILRQNAVKNGVVLDMKVYSRISPPTD